VMLAAQSYSAPEKNELPKQIRQRLIRSTLIRSNPVRSNSGCGGIGFGVWFGRVRPGETRPRRN
jgi:hypothetical protein